MSGQLRERARRTTGAAVLAAVAFVSAGCGSGEPAASASRSPDQATSQCRAQWADLADRIEGNEKREEPSALGDRWNSVVATVDYYASSARSEDCGQRLDDQKKAIARLEAFGKSLRPWDMEYQLTAIQDRAEAYDPSSHAKKRHTKGKKKQKKAREKPTPKAVQKALATLRKQAPRATEDQRPGWQQTHVVDLDNKSAVKKARKDLDFLSHQSKAWRECEDALHLIRKALRS